MSLIIQVPPATCAEQVWPGNSALRSQRLCAGPSAFSFRRNVLPATWFESVMCHSRLARRDPRCTVRKRQVNAVMRFEALLALSNNVQRLAARAHTLPSASLLHWRLWEEIVVGLPEDSQRGASSTLIRSACSYTAAKGRATVCR